MFNKIGMKLGAATLAAMAVFGGNAADAQPQAGVKAGALACNVAGGWGVIFGSTRELTCSYQSTKSTVEHYRGRISKFGVDIGYTHGGVIIWAVLAPTTDISPGAIAGHYAGATAGATVGVGAGVHALVGGFGKSIVLQPVSVEGNVGLNVAAGVADLTLTHVSQE